MIFCPYTVYGDLFTNILHLN